MKEKQTNTEYTSFIPVFQSIKITSASCKLQIAFGDKSAIVDPSILSLGAAFIKCD